jgi:hypothetical protein
LLSAAWNADTVAALQTSASRPSPAIAVGAATPVIHDLKPEGVPTLRGRSSRLSFIMIHPRK